MVLKYAFGYDRRYRSRSISNSVSQIFYSSSSRGKIYRATKFQVTFKYHGNVFSHKKKYFNTLFQLIENNWANLPINKISYAVSKNIH